MSQTVDHRVVEMRFDNKQFESGAKQTMSTLGKLKEALKLPETGKAFEDLNKATKEIKLDGITAGIEALERRFSTLGIVGMRVIENITDGLMNKLHTAVNFVTDSIVSGGIKRAMNIENAHFQLQALLKDETKVQAVMADAMESVDGTAYAYDEAAKAASQFAASGIQAGEEMLNALKGITGVAAMTNSSFEDVSRIFTTVAGNGRLMGDQLLQLSSRGLNAASTLADYFIEVRGQAGMTEATIREMVSKGQISFKDFSDAMTWAFGDSAKRANETFTGAMSNMKSALARIGAGFISPLVEQNGELVQLFNALRIKINDVKTELVFDEKSSLLSGLTKSSELLLDNITVLVKNGEVGFEEITNAIIGTEKSERELTAINKKLSDSYNEVKENGSATVQTLIDFNDNGINASKAIREYMNGVLDGSIKVSDGIKKSIEDITGGVRLGAGEATILAKEGKISYDIFTDAIVHSSGVIEENSKLTTDAISNMMNQIKENGSVTVDTLIEFNKNGMNAATALRKYMNGVLDGSIRASYATKQAIEEMTNSTEVLSDDIMRLAEEGKIGFDVFQSAMETFYGDQKPLSKQFTDFFLDNIKMIVSAINEMDMTKPMEIFYYWVESTKNVIKGLLSVIKPVGKAFADVFFVFNTDEIIKFSDAIEQMTSKLKLSENGSKNLYDAFQGLFSVVKLVVDIFFKLLGAIIPLNKPIEEMGGGFLGLIGIIGRGLTSFTEMVRSCELLKRAFGVLESGFSTAMNGLSKLIKIGKDFISTLSRMEGTTKLINSVTGAFKKLGTKVTPYIEDFIREAENLFKTIFNFEDINLENILDKVSKAFSKIASVIDNFSFQTVGDAFDDLRKKVKSFLDLVMSNEGIAAFVTKFKEFAEQLKDTFTLDNLLDRLEKVMDVFGKFFNWVKDTMAPAFKDFNVGNTIAAGGSIGLIYAIIKMSKAFEKITRSITAIPNLLGSVKDILVAYQKALKADAMIKIAGAILILSAAITLLSFADMKRAAQAAIMLGIIGAALVLAVGYFMDVVKKTKTVNDATFMLTKAANNLAKALKWKAIGSTVKDFGKTILMIGVAIIGMGLMYEKNPDAMNSGIKFVEGIAIALAGLMIVGSLIGKVAGKGMTNFSILLGSITSLAIGLSLTVLALNKLFKMELPSDWKTKVMILGGLLLGVSLLALVLGIAGKIAGGGSVSSLMGINLPSGTRGANAINVVSNGGSISAGPILALAGSLYIVVAAINKLFKMDLPSDYGEKLFVLTSIFIELAGLMVALGVASRIAKGQMKATGTILAMTAFLAVAVGGLMILAIIPGEKLIKGAISLGIILTTLGIALVGAGKVTNANTYKSIAAMALTIGVITASLSLLSMVSGSNLLKSTTALGAIMLILATDFMAVSKITNNSAWVNILFMIGTILSIAYSITALSKQPWEGLISAASALSMVLLSMSASLLIISKAPLNLKSIANFLVGMVGVVGIAVVLYKLSEQPWENLLAAGASLSLVLLSMTAAMAVCALLGAPGISAGVLPGLILLDLFITNIALILAALGKIFESEDSKALIANGAEMFKMLGQAIGDFIGAIVGGLLEGALNGIANSLPALGEGLSEFMDNLGGFIEGSKSITDEVLKGVGILAASIIAISAAEVISGVSFFLGGAVGLLDLAANLVLFIETLDPFLSAVEKIDSETLESVGSLASMIIMLTGAELLTGISRLFGFSGSLSEFAEELESLGDPLVNFAETTKGITSESVEGAANAIGVLAEAAGKLQGHGGFIQSIVGDKSLATFAEELVAFGPEIVEFAEIVKDVKPEYVEGAASAANIMAEVADNLPSIGGLADKIFGSKSLSEFGSELVSFGPKVKEFTRQVRFINPSSIDNVVVVTSIMSALADELPNSDTLWEKIFGGGKGSLAGFAEELVKFGENMVDFSDSLSDFDVDRVNAIIASFKDLVDLANSVQGTSAIGLVDFLNQFTKIGSDTGKIGKGIPASELLSFSNQFAKMGSDAADNLIQGFKDGIESKKSLVLTSVSNLCIAVTDKFRVNLKRDTFKTYGEDVVTWITRGMDSKKSSVEYYTTQTCKTIVDVFRNELSEAEFKEIGANATLGLKNGIESKINEIAIAAIKAAQKAVDSAKETLDEHSPSAVATEIGEFFSVGIAIGIVNQLKAIALAGKRAADEAIDPVKKSVDGITSIIDSENFNVDPVIRPIVDLSDVQRGAKEIGSLMNQTYDLSSVYDRALDISSFFNRNQKSITDSETLENKTKEGTNVEFYQYNYSPKALSRMDIYRQTKNLTNQMKGLIK